MRWWAKDRYPLFVFNIDKTKAKKKNKMVQSCTVVGCTNRWQKGSKISWHRFPSETDQERRRLWINALNRKDWEPNPNDRVCGRHFISGCASTDPLNPDYIPNIALGYDKENFRTPELKKGRLERAERRDRHKSDTENASRAMSNAASALLDLSNSFQDCSFSLLDADTEESPPKTKDTSELGKCIEEVASLRMQNRLLTQELGRLQEENRLVKEEMKANKFGAEYLKGGNSNQRTSFYTGLPNYAVFKWLATYVSDSLPHFDSLVCDDVVLIVLMKIRLNTQNFDLGCRFGVSSTTIGEILNKSMPVIAKKLSPLVHWPEKEDVLRTLPSVFKNTYKNTRVIIDCTEIFIERPGNLTARAATWSNYKHNNTLKYLVGITPCGAISFISRAFGGRTSDKVITQRSGFLDLLEHSDVVMADRGFLIEEDVAARNCYLVMPSFTRGKTQLTQKQVEVSRQMSRLRIHVERAIQRLKNFKILSTCMGLSMVPHADNILTIASAVCNLQPKLVK